MIDLQNLHTHTTYCDGQDTPSEMAQAALEQGFTSLGFSGHCYMPIALNYCMTEEGMISYCREIAELKEKYRGLMEIFCGLEFDLYADLDLSTYDYIIGSVHYLKKDGDYVDFDKDAETVQGIVRTEFQGDGLAFAKAYYETIAELAGLDRVDIVGHFDLVTKVCERVPGLVPWESPAYQRAALDALHAVAEKHPVFEINTGAIARGYRTTPYPAPFLLRELRRIGGNVIITADCHDSRWLKRNYTDACELAKSCGFTEQLVLRKSGFEAVAL